MKVELMFKNPDAAHEIMTARHPRSEKKREKFSDEYFEYGEYGYIEIDTETLTARLLPRSEWK